jgi:uncharacterized damage-inducible protein DinB
MTTALQDSVAATLSGDPWYGPSPQSLLEDLTPEEAGAHPVAGGHSILEIVLHVSAWLSEVAARLQGKAPSDPAAGDWPSLQGDTSDRWAAARARIAASQAEVAAALEAFPPSRKDERVGGERDAALGTGLSFEAMILGVAEHNAYHAGQVALLKRALREGRGTA